MCALMVPRKPFFFPLRGEDEAVTEYIKNIIKTSHDIDEAMKRCSTGLDQMATHDGSVVHIIFVNSGTEYNAGV